MMNFKNELEEQRIFTATEIAQILDIDANRIYLIKKRHKIKPCGNKGRELTYDYKAFKLFKADIDYFRKEKERVENNKKKKLETVTASEKTIAQSKEHPLVTDLRYLNFNYWPDVIPACFEDIALD